MHRPDASVVSACTVCGPSIGFIILPATAAGHIAQHGIQLVIQHRFLIMLLPLLPFNQYAASFAKCGDHPFEPGEALEGGQHCITQSSFASPELQDKQDAHDVECS